LSLVLSTNKSRNFVVVDFLKHKGPRFLSTSKSLKMNSRVKFDKVEFSDVMLTKEYLDFLVATHDLFAPSVEQIRKKRNAQLQKALKEGIYKFFLIEI